MLDDISLPLQRRNHRYSLLVIQDDIEMTGSSDDVEKTALPPYAAGEAKMDNPTFEKDIDHEIGDSESVRRIATLPDGFVVDKKLERKMLFKFDIYILPMLAMMYLFK